MMWFFLLRYDAIQYDTNINMNAPCTRVPWTSVMPGTVLSRSQELEWSTSQLEGYIHIETSKQLSMNRDRCFVSMPPFLPGHVPYLFACNSHSIRAFHPTSRNPNFHPTWSAVYVVPRLSHFFFRMIGLESLQAIIKPIVDLFCLAYCGTLRCSFLNKSIHKTYVMLSTINEGSSLRI